MKNKEGGAMDIQKERELCEVEFEKEWDSFCEAYGNGYNKSVAKYFFFEAWQAAKAQAVPELTDKMIVAIESEVESQLKASAIDADPFRLDGEKIWYAAVEAQEPAND